MDGWLAEAIGRWLDRGRVIVVAALLAVILWMATAAAIAKPFWHDEIYTILLAKLPSVGAIWTAHRQGVDLQPPLNTYLTRLTHRTVGSGPIATRLPPLAGFVLATLTVAAMLRRRVGMTLALAGALIPMQTAAYRYGYEARGYGLMLGFFAVALFAWAEAAQGRRRRLWIPLLALALAAGVWTHYYAAFAFVAIGGGELARSIRARHVDRGILAALLGGGSLTLPLLLLLATGIEQLSAFWAKAGEEGVVAGIVDVYGFLLGPLAAFLWSWRGALVVLALIFTATTVRAARPVLNLPSHEAIAVGLTALAPIAMLIAARTAGAPFTARYGLIAVVAVAIGIPLLVRRIAPGGSLAEVVLVGVLAAPLLTGAIGSASQPRVAADPFAERALLTDALRGAGPLVASGSLTYLQLWYYAPPLERGRLTYLADPATALRLTGSDTLDRGYLALARYTTLPVEPHAKFLAQHPEFRLYASGSGWLLTLLDEQGAALDLRGVEPGGRLFTVRR